eukprot:m.92914 g.92914  ORF g.92914 m.92914 type:complete len:298 (-) comp13370_c0_seq3:151-1044(-)
MRGCFKLNLASPFRFYIKTGMECKIAGIAVPVEEPTKAWEKLQVKLKAEEVKSNVGRNPCANGNTRWVCISDTHGRHTEIKDLPKGDVLIHAGDITRTGDPEELQSFRSWLQSLDFKHKIVIAGNHDITVHESFYKENWSRFHYGKPKDSGEARAILTSEEGFTYLEDSAVEIFGYKVYGSPWQPEFCNWAYNLDRTECGKKWEEIPTDTDVLLTHGPPLGHGDECKGGHRAGCVELLKTCTERVNPLVHVFGHIHESYGTTTNGNTKFINASTCTYSYKPTNPPIVFDLPIKNLEN